MYLVRSIPEAIELLEKLSLEDVVETVWIGGGAGLYKVDHNLNYLTLEKVF